VVATSLQRIAQLRWLALDLFMHIAAVALFMAPSPPAAVTLISMAVGGGGFFL